MAYVLHNAAATGFATTLMRFMSADGFDAADFLTTCVTDPVHEALFYVVPTRRRARWLQREITRRVFSRTQQPLLGVRFLNLADLALALYSRFYDILQPLLLTDALQMALLERIIDTCASNGALPFYAPTRKPAWSIIERLASIVAGLREDGITPEDLEHDLLPSRDELIDRNRLADIYTIYRAYVEILGKPFLDTTALFDAVSDALTTDPVCSDGAPIVIEGFSSFRIPEVRMLGRLAESKIPVCIVLAYSPPNGPLFGNLDATLNTLLTLGYQAHSFDPLSDDGKSLWYYPRTAYLRRWLFNTEQEIRNPEFNRCITLLGCTNQLEEVTLIAKYVKYCLYELGYKPDQICIATRSPELYTSLFRELFAVHGIPANITDRFRLDRSPVAVAVMSVLELIIRGYRREDLHRMLSNPLIHCTRDDGSTIDAATINDVAERQRISGGHVMGSIDEWIRRIEQALTNSARYLERLSSEPYADPIDLQHAQQEVLAISRARDDLHALRKLLLQPARQMTISEFCSFVRTVILEKLGIARSVEEAFERSWELPKNTPIDTTQTEFLEQETRAYAAIIRLLAEMEYAWNTMKNSSQQRPFAEYVEMLATMMRATRYQVAEKPGYGVTVTSIEQTRGIPYDVYILCGMVDGNFPTAYAPEHFLGKELPESQERHIRAERIQFYEALTNNPPALERGTWQMLITYPRLTTDGEPLVRSSFIDKLLKITTLAERTFNSHELLHEGESPTQSDQWAWVRTITSVEERYEESMHPWQPPQEVRLDTATLDVLSPRLKHPFSSHELEQYASCPYQYFAERVLQLRTPQRYDLALSSLESGSLLHSILYHFYYTLLEQEGTSDERTGIRWVRPDPSRRDQYQQLLLTIARQELERYQHSHPLFALECEQLLGTKHSKGILEEWLDRELSRFKEGWEYTPALFEVAFGTHTRSQNDPDAPVQLTPTVTIRGKIDRIEVRCEGTQYHILIADYKLRRKGSTNSDIKKGQAFQMPLYMLAARELFKRRWRVDPLLDGGIYYLIRAEHDKSAVAMPQDANTFAYEHARSRSQIVADRTEQEELLQMALSHAERIISFVNSGFFPITPINKTTCQHCAFGSVCRIRQLREEGFVGPAEENGAE